MTKRSLVSIVDDDQSVRASMPELLKEFGLAVRVFSSGEGFLASAWIEKTKCLILDIDMPGMSGNDVREELKRRGADIPTIFITAHGDETVRAQMLELGAIECLFKPFGEIALLDAINAALRSDKDDVLLWVG